MRKRKNESRQNIVAQKIEPLSRRCVGPLGALRYRRSTNGKRLFMARALGAGTRRASAPRAERQGADDGRHEDPTHRHIPRALPTIRVSSCRDDLAFGWGDRPQRRSYYTIKSVITRSLKRPRAYQPPILLYDKVRDPALHACGPSRHITLRVPDSDTSSCPCSSLPSA